MRISGKKRLLVYSWAYGCVFVTCMGLGLLGAPVLVQIPCGLVSGIVAIYIGLTFAQASAPHALEIVIGPPPDADPKEWGWEPPVQQRGDLIVEGTICRPPEGTTERIVLLVQKRRHMITGFDRPIIITPYAHVHVTIGGEEKMPPMTTTSEPRRRWLWL